MYDGHAALLPVTMGQCCVHCCQGWHSQCVCVKLHSDHVIVLPSPWYKLNLTVKIIVLNRDYVVTINNLQTRQSMSLHQYNINNPVQSPWQHVILSSLSHTCSNPLWYLPDAMTIITGNFNATVWFINLNWEHNEFILFITKYEWLTMANRHIGLDRNLNLLVNITEYPINYEQLWLLIHKVPSGAFAQLLLEYARANVHVFIF